MIELVVEADNQRLAFPQGGRSKIAGGAQHQFLERRLVRLFFFQVDMDQPLPLGDVQIAGRARQCQGVFGLQRILPRIELFDGVDVCLRKKLLRPTARRSAGAMVAPVDLGHAQSSLNSCRPPSSAAVDGPGSASTNGAAD